MGGEWQEAYLTDLYDIGSGLSKPAKDFGSGYPFLAFKDVFNNYFLPKTLTQLVQSSEKEQRTCSVKRGDVFLTRTSETMDELGMSSVALKDYEKATFNGFTKRLRPKDGNCLIPEYVGYFFRSPRFRKEMLAFSTMSTRASLNNEMISRLKISFPSVQDQKAIAQVLKALDDKIELNRQMNATLEAMAQALFKSWFVDFDPVIDNALAAGNPIPDELQARAEVRAGLGDKRKPLPEAIQKQFPSSFVFSEAMGWIPDGWDIGPVSVIADLNPEMWGPRNHPDFVKYVDLANTKNGRINEKTIFAFSEAPSRARRVLRKDDTVIGTVRPANRSFALVCEDGLTGSTGFAVMRGKNSFSRSFVYLALTRDETIEVLAHLADGAAYPAVRPDVVASQLVTIPDTNLINLFDKFAYAWLSKIGENESMTDSLSQLRDTLRPKLLSGQLRIPEAEKLVERVVA